jgi:hypothetical protein
MCARGKKEIRTSNCFVLLPVLTKCMACLFKLHPHFITKPLLLQANLTKKLSKMGIRLSATKINICQESKYVDLLFLQYTWFDVVQLDKFQRSRSQNCISIICGRISIARTLDKSLTYYSVLAFFVACCYNTLIVALIIHAYEERFIWGFISYSTNVNRIEA